jgi:hypothetical protein
MLPLRRREVPWHGNVRRLRARFRPRPNVTPVLYLPLIAAMWFTWQLASRQFRSGANADIPGTVHAREQQLKHCPMIVDFGERGLYSFSTHGNPGETDEQRAA